MKTKTFLGYAKSFRPNLLGSPSGRALIQTELSTRAKRRAEQRKGSRNGK